MKPREVSKLPQGTQGRKELHRVMPTIGVRQLGFKSSIYLEGSFRMLNNTIHVKSQVHTRSPSPRLLHFLRRCPLAQTQSQLYRGRGGGLLSCQWSPNHIAYPSVRWFFTPSLTLEMALNRSTQIGAIASYLTPPTLSSNPSRTP